MISERKLKNIGLKRQGKRYTLEKEFTSGYFFNLSMSDEFKEVQYCITNMALDKLSVDDLDKKKRSKFDKYFDELVSKLEKLDIRIG